MIKSFASPFLLVLCINLSIWITGCINHENEIIKSIDFKEPLISLEEDSTITLTIKSNKSFSTTDTILIQMISGDAVYGDDFTTSIPVKNDLIELVGTGTADSLSFSLTAIFDNNIEETETAIFEIVKFPNGLKLGLQKNITLEIRNKNSLKKDLIAEYLFTGNASDSSGNNLHGIVNSAILTSDRHGNNNSAYYFDGNSNIEVANHNLLNFTNNFTLCAWINPALFKTSGTRIIDKAVGSKGDGFLLDTYSQNQEGKRIRMMLGGNGWYFLSETDLSVNQWYFIVATYKDGVGQIYINGELNLENTSNSTTIIPSSTPMRFGFDSGVRTGGDYDDSFVGKLDEIRIYGRVLSTEEIEALYSDDIL